MDDTFVIGDVHGHLDRLEALLKQEGFLDRCEACDGGGEEFRDGDGRAYGAYVDCTKCDGLGWARLRPEVTIVQLGDLGHFGGTSGSPTGDILCYKYVTDNRWADIVLWGNHDRALADPQHAFSGYLKNIEAGHYIRKLEAEDRMLLAYEAHGFLITHAGLHMAFRDQRVDPELKSDPAKLAAWLNDQDRTYLHGKFDKCDPQSFAIRDAIGRTRGGRVNAGGILWRDINEKLYDGFPQVFGHSADQEEGAVRYCWKNGYTRAVPEADSGDWSYCIDVGGKRGHGYEALAGIYLPSEKIVRVDLGNHNLDNDLRRIREAAQRVPDELDVLKLLTDDQE